MKSQRITPQELLYFYSQLSILITAGLSLIKSLDVLIQSNHNSVFRSFIQTIRADLERGKEFNCCLQRYPQLFDLFTCQLIHIGEQTGTLDQVLQRIALYKEKTQLLRKQLKQALLYPSLILMSALVTTFILLFFVVPQFASLFEHFPNKIPFLTQALIQLSLSLHQWLPWLGFFCLINLLAFFHLRNSTFFQMHCQRALFQLPYISKLILKIALTQFTQTLALILSAGLSLTEGLVLVAQLSPFEEFRKAIFKVYIGVHSGNSLSTNLQLNPLFPTLLVHMTKVGEESGNLDFMLKKFADLYEAELEHSFHTLKLMLEPLIIAILGVLIGGIVIALYLPIFRLGTSLS